MSIYYTYIVKSMTLATCNIWQQFYGSGKIIFYMWPALCFCCKSIFSITLLFMPYFSAYLNLSVLATKRKLIIFVSSVCLWGTLFALWYQWNSQIGTACPSVIDVVAVSGVFFWPSILWPVLWLVDFTHLSQSRRGRFDFLRKAHSVLTCVYGNM